jgi:hypothetical protein
MPHSPRVEEINKKETGRDYPNVFDDGVNSRFPQVNIRDEEDERYEQIEQSSPDVPATQGDCPEKQKNDNGDETDDINYPDPQPIFKVVMVLYPCREESCQQPHESIIRPIHIPSPVFLDDTI